MSASLPIAIERFVRRHVTRRRWLALVQSLGAGLFLALAWALLAMLLDRLFRMGPPIRLALLIVGAAILLTPILLPLWRLLRRRIDYLQGAAEIESAQGGFGQKLLTVVSQLHERDEYRGSPQMVQWLVDEVTRETASRRPGKALPWRAALRPWAGVVLLSIVLAVGAFVPWFGQGRLVRRLATPLAGIPPVSTTQISLEPGHIRLLHGQPLTIRARAKSLDGASLDILTSTDGGVWSRLPMLAVSDSEFHFNLPSVEQAFRYYITGGDAQTEVFQVTVLRAPAVAELALTYHYPPYTGRESWSQTTGDGIADALVGTRLHLRLTASEDLASAALVFGGEQVPLRQARSRQLFETELTIRQSQTADLVMTGAEGLAARIPRVLTIKAQADRPPLARIIDPSSDLRLAPRDLLEVQSQFMDDYGVASASLQVQVNAQPPRLITVPVAPEPRRVDARTTIDLAEFPLSVGDIVVITATADDGAGQRAQRESRTIVIAPRSVDAARLRFIAELRRALQLSGEVKRDLDQAVAGAQSMRDRPGDSLSDSLRARRSLGSASENALLLHQALLRAVARSPAPPVTTVLAALVDDARQVSALTERMAALDADGAPRRLVADALRDLAAQFTPATTRLRTLADAQLSEVVLAERQNLKSLPPDKSGDKRWRDALKRAQQDQAANLQELGLQNGGPNLDERLQRRIESGAQLARDAARLQLADAAERWAEHLLDARPLPPPLSQRLASASSVQALRPDSDPVLARDYQLAARAVASLAQAELDETSRQRIAELGAVLRLLEEDAAQRTGEPARPEAEDARATLVQWAQAPTREPADDLPLQASAAMARRDYTEAAQLDARHAGASPEAARLAPELARRLDAARAIDQSTRDQAAAAALTDRDAADTAQQQRRAADRIAALGPPAPGLDARRDAVSLLEKAQRDLAAFPGHLTDALKLATNYRDTQAAVAIARETLDEAPPERRGTAQRALTAAQSAATDARKTLDAALTSLSASRAEALATELRPLEPEAASARSALATRLQPALAGLAVELREGRGESAARSLREALEASQLALGEARQRILERDPLLAARWYAEAAAAALEARPPDLRTARQFQADTLQSLGRAWQDNLRHATARRLELSPAFRPILRSDAAETVRSSRLSGLAPAAREWGSLPQRLPDAVSGSARESDSPAFQEPLKHYFDALNKAQDQASRK